MINILSFLGMGLQSEVCLWTLLGILTTVFDATLFKVNSDLKEVWQMRMPDELSTPLQRVVRTLISGLMLMQCFTVYVYLAAYVVLLYPVFLEERPTLVLPWLLLAAVRKLLCELTSLALGLGVCVLLGASRPPCIKFVITKVFTITPAFYMWLLVLSYYHTLKVASSYKTFRTVVLTPSQYDDGLELAVRRRLTKSLQAEDTLRKNLLRFYSERHLSITNDPTTSSWQNGNKSRMVHSTTTSNEEFHNPIDVAQSFILTSKERASSTIMQEVDDGIVLDVVVPRDTDRIMEQFAWMILKVQAYKKKQDEGEEFPSTRLDSELPLDGRAIRINPVPTSSAKTGAPKDVIQLGPRKNSSDIPKPKDYLRTNSKESMESYNIDDKNRTRKDTKTNAKNGENPTPSSSKSTKSVLSFRSSESKSGSSHKPSAARGQSKRSNNGASSSQEPGAMSKKDKQNTNEDDRNK